MKYLMFFITDGSTHSYSSAIQWNPSNADTIGTTAACLEYRGVHILEGSCRRVLMLLSTIKVHSEAVPCALARKTNKRLLLCVAVLL